MSEDAIHFMNYHFLHTKDLCLNFLPLVVSVLVFSVAFSDKITNFQNAPSAKKGPLLFTWASLILSIILCGIGLALLALVGGKVVYAKTMTLDQIKSIAALPNYFLLGAGICFITGLLSLTFAGFQTLKRRESNSPQID